MTKRSSPTAAEHRALLFSGHMIDAPGRAQPRFPPTLEASVARAIDAELERIHAARSGDVALASAACGGDILFDEAVLRRNLPLTVHLPFDEPTFLRESVAFANDRWPARYRAIVARATRLVAPDVLGPLAPGADPYERVNQWMLDEARRIAGDDVAFICLWNGEGGDGPGGTKHMMDVVRAAGGDVHWIDIRAL